jgi:hypothetical protein
MVITPSSPSPLILFFRNSGKLLSPKFVLKSDAALIRQGIIPEYNADKMTTEYINDANLIRVCIIPEFGK